MPRSCCSARAADRSAHAAQIREAAVRRFSAPPRERRIGAPARACRSSARASWCATCDNSGIDRRHNFGTHAALFGVNPWRLQGHKRIEETMLYVHVANNHRRQIPEDILAA